MPETQQLAPFRAPLHQHHLSLSPIGSVCLNLNPEHVFTGAHSADDLTSAVKSRTTFSIVSAALGKTMHLILNTPTPTVESAVHDVDFVSASSLYASRKT